MATANANANASPFSLELDPDEEPVLPGEEAALPWSSLFLDLLHDVLLRLSMKTLLRLRLVCKEFRDIIDEPCFAERHASSAVEGPEIMVLSTAKRQGAEAEVAVNRGFVKVSVPKMGSYTTARPRGSCRGLLCFANLRDGKVFLFNPLLRELVSLPIIADPARKQANEIAVGFDWRTNRYKLVHVRWPLFGESPDVESTAYVLDQGSRSWRRIKSAPPLCPLSSGPVYASGSIHWTAGGSIVSFNLAKEEFVLTPCPSFAVARVVELRGALGLVDCSRQSRLDVWVMKEGGEWTRDYTVRLSAPSTVGDYRYLEVVGAWGNGRKIVIRYCESFFAYDPASDGFAYMNPLPGLGMGETEVCCVAWSLVSPAKLWSVAKR